MPRVKADITLRGMRVTKCRRDPSLVGSVIPWSNVHLNGGLAALFTSSHEKIGRTNCRLRLSDKKHRVAKRAQFRALRQSYEAGTLDLPNRHREMPKIVERSACLIIALFIFASPLMLILDDESQLSLQKLQTGLGYGTPEHDLYIRVLAVVVFAGMLAFLGLFVCITFVCLRHEILGWRLSRIKADSFVLERGTETRTIAIDSATVRMRLPAPRSYTMHSDCDCYRLKSDIPQRSHFEKLFVRPKPSRVFTKGFLLFSFAMFFVYALAAFLHEWGQSIELVDVPRQTWWVWPLYFALTWGALVCGRFSLNRTRTRGLSS